MKRSFTRDESIWKAGFQRDSHAVSWLKEAWQEGPRDEEHMYAIAWALGRCGDEELVRWLESQRKGVPAYVRRMLDEAIRFLTLGEKREEWVRPHRESLPPSVRQSATPAALVVKLETLMEEQRFSDLYTLYLVDDALTRPALLELLAKVPIQAYFHELRKIYKASEFREDPEVFGLLVYRWNASLATGDVTSSEPDGRAWSVGTRIYFRRRAWWYLRRLGEVGGDAYVRMARGLLLAYNQFGSMAPPVASLSGMELKMAKGVLQGLPEAAPTKGNAGHKNHPIPLTLFSGRSLRFSRQYKEAYFSFLPFCSGSYEVEVRSNYSGRYSAGCVVTDSKGGIIESVVGAIYQSTTKICLSLKAGETYTFKVKPHSRDTGNAGFRMTLRSAGFWRLFPKQFLGGNSEPYTVLDDAYALRWVMHGAVLGAEERTQPGTVRWRRAVQNAKELAKVERCEEFPAYWDERLDDVLAIFLESNCEEIQIFALRILQKHPKFCAKLSMMDLLLMLRMDSDLVHGFVLSEVFARDFSGFGPEVIETLSGIVPNLLGSEDENQRALALRWFALEPTRYLENVPFLIGLMTSDYEDVREAAALLLRANAFSAEKQLAIFVALFQACAEKYHQKRLPTHVRSTMMQAFPKALAQIHPTQLMSWLASELDDLQDLACWILMRSEPTEWGKHEPLLCLLCFHDKKKVRESVRPLLRRLRSKKKGFSKAFCQSIWDELMTLERGAGAYNIRFTPGEFPDKSSLDGYTMERIRLAPGEASLLPLSESKRIFGPQTGSRQSQKLPFGFSFPFGGNVYKRFWVHTDGWICLQGSNWVNYRPAHFFGSKNSGVGLIPWGGQWVTGRDGEVRMASFGKAPSRVQVVEWKVWTYAYQNQANFIQLTFQCCMHETSGVIEFRYGKPVMQGEPPLGFPAVCGIRITTQAGTKGRVRDCFGDNGEPPGSDEPFRTDLQMGPSFSNFPGDPKNLGLLRPDEDLSLLEEKTKSVAETLLLIFGEELLSLSLEQVHRLLCHGLSSFRSLGAEILLQLPLQPTVLSDTLYEDLILAEESVLQNVGLRLLGQLSVNECFRRKALLLRLFVNECPNVLRQMRPLACRLAQADAAFGMELVTLLLAEAKAAFVETLQGIVTSMDAGFLSKQHALLLAACTHQIRSLREVFWPLVERLAKEAPELATKLAFDLLKEIPEKPHQCSNDPGVEVLEERILRHFDHAELLAQASLLFQLSIHPREALNRLGSSLLRNVSQEYPGSEPLLVGAVVSLLFRREAYEGAHQRLVEMLDTTFQNPMAAIDLQTTMRLVYAKSDVVQEFGMRLLRRVRASDLTLRKIAKLGSHAMFGVRQECWRMYRQSLDRIKADMAEGLRILDADWEDSRHFGFDLFREECGEEEFTATVLVSICDSVRDDVQQFGRELITKYFGPEDGPEYLEKLSEHPSPNVELFVTNYLSRYAAGHSERVMRLKPYFLRVLCRVNQGRSAKDRVFSFLHKEGQKDEEMAKIVMEIFGWMSATGSVGERADYIRGMVDLQRAFPALVGPIRVKSVEVRAGGQDGV